MNQEHIENEYQKLVDWHKSVNRNNRETGCETVLRFMFENQQRVWWWSWEFVGKSNSKGGYLSHRAPARASDLAIHYPNLVEDRKIGRFSVYRLKLENMDQILSFLNESSDYGKDPRQIPFI